jgi:hypothetical protein
LTKVLRSKWFYLGLFVIALTTVLVAIATAKSTPLS